MRASSQDALSRGGEILFSRFCFQRKSLPAFTRQLPPTQSRGFLFCILDIKAVSMNHRNDRLEKRSNRNAAGEIAGHLSLAAFKTAPGALGSNLGFTLGRIVNSAKRYFRVRG
jgi:hypothetical protein